MVSACIGTMRWHDRWHRWVGCVVFWVCLHRRRFVSFLVGSSTGDGAFTGVGLTGGLTIVISCDSSSESDTSVSMISSFSWIRLASTSFLFAQRCRKDGGINSMLVARVRRRWWTWWSLFSDAVVVILLQILHRLGVKSTSGNLNILCNSRWGALAYFGILQPCGVLKRCIEYLRACTTTQRSYLRKRIRTISFRISWSV